MQGGDRGGPAARGLIRARCGQIRHLHRRDGPDLRGGEGRQERGEEGEEEGHSSARLRVSPSAGALVPDGLRAGRVAHLGTRARRRGAALSHRALVRGERLLRHRVPRRLAVVGVQLSRLHLAGAAHGPRAGADAGRRRPLAHRRLRAWRARKFIQSSSSRGARVVRRRMAPPERPLRCPFRGGWLVGALAPNARLHRAHDPIASHHGVFHHRSDTAHPLANSG